MSTQSHSDNNRNSTQNTWTVMRRFIEAPDYIVIRKLKFAEDKQKIDRNQGIPLRKNHQRNKEDSKRERKRKTNYQSQKQSTR